MLDAISKAIRNSSKDILNKEYLFAAGIGLALSGLLFSFFLALSFAAGEWLGGSLPFLGYFFSLWVILGVGIFIVRSRSLKSAGHHSLYDAVKASWKQIILSSTVMLPMIAAFAAIWFCLGVFVLFAQLPHAGTVFAALFAFIPFLLFLLLILMAVAAPVVLFFCLPILAQHDDLSPKELSLRVWHRWRDFPFKSFADFIVALIPLAVLFVLMQAAMCLTIRLLAPAMNEIEFGIMALMTLLPFSVLLAPGLLFFFSYSVESHHELSNS